MLPVLQDLIAEYTGRTFRLHKESLRICLNDADGKEKRHLDFRVKPGVWVVEWGPWLYMPPGEQEEEAYRALVLRTGTDIQLPSQITISVPDFEEIEPIESLLLCSDKPLLNIINLVNRPYNKDLRFYLLSAYHAFDAIVLLFGRADWLNRVRAKDIRYEMERELYDKAREVLQELKITEDGVLGWVEEGYVYLLLHNGKRDLPKLFTPNEIKRFVSADLSPQQLEGSIRVEFMGGNNVGIKADDDNNDPEGVEENPILFERFSFPNTQKLSDYMGSIGPENFEPTAYSVAKTPKYLEMYYAALRKLDTE